MVDRIRLEVPIYMPIDGQWDIVLPGTVLDVASATAFATGHVTILSPSEPAGTLASHGKPTPVRNVRRKG